MGGGLLGGGPRAEVAMNIRMVLGGGFVVLLVVVAMRFGGTLGAFIDMPSVFIVVGVTVGATIWSSPMSDIGLAVAKSLGSGPISEEEAHRAHAVLQHAANAAVAGGTIGTVIGLVQMLQNLDDPSAIGPAMAVALLTLLYGLLLGEVFLRSAAADLLARSDGTPPKPHARRGASSTYAALFALLLVMGTFLVMMLALS